MKNLTLLLIFIALSGNLLAQTELLNEGFEGSEFPPTGWTKMMSTGIDGALENYPASLEWYEQWAHLEQGVWTTSNYIHNGQFSACVGGTFAAEPKHDWLITPFMDIPETGETNLNYWMWYHSATPSYWTWLYVMVQEEGSDTWTQDTLMLWEESIALHYTEEHTSSLNEFAGKRIKLAFVKNGTYQFAMDDIRVITDGPNALDEKSSSLVNVWPNPVSSTLNISSAIFNKHTNYSISNMMGQEIMCGMLTMETINMEALTEGIYSITFYGSGQPESTKIVVRH